MPTPRLNRPPLRTSREAAWRARSVVSRVGAMTTLASSRIRLVTPTTDARTINGSCAGDDDAIHDGKARVRAPIGLRGPVKDGLGARGCRRG